MSEIRVTFSALAAAQSDVGSTAARIGTQLEDLRRYLAPMAATWEGDAAVYYQERQREWDAAAADLNAVLAQIGQSLGLASDSYRSVEQLNSGRWVR